MKAAIAFAAFAASLASGGALAQAQSGNCSACHGERGEGNAAAGFPRLAGQPKEYLKRQLDAYADGSRTNEVMMPIAKAMTPEERESAAAHFASLDGGTGKAAAKAGGAGPARGRALARVGDHARQIQACENCHGPDGIGEPPANPYLAGQELKYLEAALQDWKSGKRSTDPSEQMAMIAKRLGAEDIAAVSRYYAAKPPPGGGQSR